MSDISIPGVSSKYNTDKLIEDLVAAERIRLERMEDQVGSYETERSTWRQLNRNLGEFQRSVKSLYGFENPFSEKAAISSNERILEASANRSAAFDSYAVKVTQVATADRLMTPSLPADFRVGAGTYTYRVGEDSVTLRYRGGSMADFARRLTDKGKGLVRAMAIRDTTDSQVMMIEAIPTGAANRLIFEQDARSLALQTGMVRRSESVDAAIDPSRALQNPVTASGALVSADSIDISDGGILLKPSSSLRIPFDSPVTLSENAVLEYRYRTVEYSDRDLIPPRPPGMRLPGGPGVEFQGISVRGEATNLDTSDSASFQPPARVDVWKVLSLEGNDGSITSLPDIQRSGDYTVVRIPASDVPAGAAALLLNNGNTHRGVQISDIRIYDPTRTGDLEPANPAGTAGDAIIEFRGITARRPTNTIDDLVDGVTFNLKRVSDEPVEIDIEPDTEAAKEGIIRFVYSYNQLLTRINVLTSNNPAVIDELDYLDDDEISALEEQQGSLRGDMAVNNLKNQLQRLVSNPYPTRVGADLTLLAQIGVSTNASSGSGGGVLNLSKLRGYLEIDEEKLDNTLSSEIDAVKDLFGSDSSGDLVIDTGVAKAVDLYVTPYTRNGGFVSTRMTRIDGQISSTKEDITGYEKHLEDYEADLRRQYGNMEGMLDQLERNSREIENFGRQQGGRR